MKWFERHLGRYAISNLSLVVIILYGFGYLLQSVNSAFLNYLTLNPYAILHGQIYRLVTWLVIPPGQSNLFYILIAMLFYYSIGTSLERTWGTVRYNFYILEGVLFTILGAFIATGIAYLLYGGALTPMDYQAISGYFSTYYVCMSIFLAYAVTFPNAIVLFMYILPVKVRWLGILYGALLLYDFVQYARYGYWIYCVAMGASLLNFLLFFIQTRDWKRYSPGEVHRRNKWRHATRGTTVDGQWTEAKTPGNTATVMRPQSRGTAMHHCAICGRTELTDPDLEFRYCSKCEGGHEFCQDHLFTHVHARNGSAPTLMEEQPVTVERDDSGNL